MIMCLFLVLLGPCPQVLGARLFSHQRVLKDLTDALSTRSDTRPLAHREGAWMVTEVMRERMSLGLVMGDHPSIAGRSRVLARGSIILEGTESKREERPRP